jgi:hypothetical protein
MSSLLTKFTKAAQSEVFHAQCTTHDALTQFYKLTGRFTSEYSP